MTVEEVSGYDGFLHSKSFLNKWLNLMTKAPIKIATSILSGDFGFIAAEAQRIEESGSDYLHIDVMDGHFVPNLTMGPQVVSAINRATDMFLDVHLMMYNPFDYIERFVEAGADMLTFHFEATEDVEDTLQYIRRCNVKAGLAFRPETSMSLIPKYLNQCDMVLIMTVDPGFGGQEFMPDMLEKVSFVRDVCDRLNIRQGGVTSKAKSKETLPPFDIEVDGGINDETVKECVKAGANVIVSGSYLFRSPDMKKSVSRLREAAEEAQKIL